MTESLQLDMGTIKIADDVVAKVAGMAALETPGIAAMSGGLSEGFAKRLSGKNVQKGVTVEVGQLEAAIDLRIIVLYETPIHEVCRMLQQNVREAVETLTGLKVVEVNVKVEGVAFKDELIDMDKTRSSNHSVKVM
ncbi:Asp23/Gls24 family envelope stress response protein [Paenibacillus campi]|uniref:Asp23/Gls24 family envelope stress response protein n=1 Tax=Paenibacillus campi TaxID=3106031 RepID=UPI002AFE4CC9|nr:MULTISPECIES: Asp23/Gls24 family envelope stress response protein [unclassified Paenibacillus]